MSVRRFKILVCRGPQCGGVRNSVEVHRAVASHIERCGLSAQIDLGWQSCFGRCTQGPNVLVRERVESPGARPRFVLASLPARRGRSALYNHVTPSDAATIIEEHVLCGRIVRKLIDVPARPSPRADQERSGADEPARTLAAKRTDGER